MGFFFSLAVTISGYAALAFLVLASLGSGMFHPAGSMQSTIIGRDHLRGKEDTTASLFFFFGQFGYFVGPLLGGPILGLWGPAGLLLLTMFVLPIGGFGSWQLRKVTRPLPDAIKPEAKFQISSLKPQFGTILVLLVVATCQSWEQQNMQIFVPKYLNDQGMRPSLYGLLAALFMGGSAIGNVFGGQVAHRIGRKAVIVGGLAIAALPIFLISQVGMSPWLYFLIPVAGMFSGAAYTCIFVASQKVVPGAMGLVSGVILSFMFSSGSVGTLISGFVADAKDFGAVFYLTAGLALVGSVTALVLKGEKRGMEEERVVMAAED
jgi:FSR family fosmidomycin resistance protein-like MFS transporter